MGFVLAPIRKRRPSADQILFLKMRSMPAITINKAPPEAGTWARASDGKPVLEWTPLGIVSLWGRDATFTLDAWGGSAGTVSAALRAVLRST